MGLGKIIRNVVDALSGQDSEQRGPPEQEGGLLGSLTNMLTG